MGVHSSLEKTVKQMIEDEEFGDTFAELSAEKLERTFKERASLAFQNFDLNSDGALDRDEYKLAIARAGIQIDDMEAFDSWYDRVDTSGEGTLAFEEFLTEALRAFELEEKGECDEPGDQVIIDEMDNV